MSYRSFVADKIRDALGDGFTVYEAGQDVIKTPAVVVHPDDPYTVPVTMSSDAAVQVFFQIWLVSNRSDILASLNQLEEMRKVVTDAIKSDPAPVGRWTGFGSFGATEIGGVQYATAIVSVTFVAADQ